MIVQTAAGSEIPKDSNAICNYEYTHIDEMDKCPCEKFDHRGNICVPSLCEYYTINGHHSINMHEEDVWSLSQIQHIEE